MEEIRKNYIVSATIRTNVISKIYIDGTFIGEGKYFTVDISKSSYKFTIESPGYQKIERTVQIVENNQIVDFVLEKIPVTPSQNKVVEKKPEELPGKKEEEKTPRQGVKTVSGKKKRSKLLYILGGTALGAVILAAVLKKGTAEAGTATLEITSEPSGAEVFLDGVNKGVTPITLTGVSEGRHELRVVLELYGEWTDVINVAGGQRYTINAVLSPFKYDFLDCLGTFGKGNYNFYHPWYVTFDNNGNLYVSDHDNHRIVKYDNQLRYKTQTELSLPTVLVYSTHHSGLLALSAYLYLIKYNNNLSPVAAWDFKLKIPSKGLAIDDKGNIYVAETSTGYLKKFNSAGGFIKKWLVRTANSQPIDVEVIRGENLIAVSSCALKRVYLFDLSGNAKGSIGSDIACPAGLAYDGISLFVSSYNGGKIIKYTLNGKRVLTIGGFGSAPRKLRNPFGIFATNDGFITVADSGNNRICFWKISDQVIPSGKATISVVRSSKNIHGNYMEGSTYKGIPAVVSKTKGKRIKKK